MWRELVKNLGTFTSAVVTGVDSSGYPYSVRCTPQIDHARQCLRVQLPPDAAIQPGPAGLLCHSHDEWLWNLRSFNALGRLALETDGWVFYPTKYIPGQGTSGLFGTMQTLFKSRRTAKQYLAKRNLQRPKVPWHDLKALRKQAKDRG